MRRFASLAVAIVAFVTANLLSAAGAQAQVFGPPMTVFGSVADSAERVAEGLTVEAYVGDKVCGRGKTQFTGEGAGRVTVYYADVVSREQTAGCGSSGIEVRVKIGDRFASQTVRWQAGPQQLDVVFGSATPAPIPTFTPTPTRTPTATRVANAPTPTASASSTAASATAVASASSTPVRGTPTPATPGTIRGGIGSAPAPATGGAEAGGGGFPVWGAVLAVIAGLALVGGGLGYLMAQNRRERDEE